MQTEPFRVGVVGQTQSRVVKKLQECYVGHFLSILLLGYCKPKYNQLFDGFSL